MDESAKNQPLTLSTSPLPCSSASGITILQNVKSNKPICENRLSNLLNKIRSKSAQKVPCMKKTKKLQLKYERYDPLISEFKIVGQKQGGGSRFNVGSSFVTLGEIKLNGQSLFFDLNGCNNFP